MKKQIIESNTEPNKNCLWLTPNGLKRYGKSGWEDLTNGSGSGGEDKVFEIKIKIDDAKGNLYNEYMINGVGWFTTSEFTDAGYEIDHLNGEELVNKSEIIRELFKDIESYNKLKLTEVLVTDGDELPLTSVEYLTYRVINSDNISATMIFSQIYPNTNVRYLLIAYTLPDGQSHIAFAW